MQHRKFKKSDLDRVEQWEEHKYFSESGNLKALTNIGNDKLKNLLKIYRGDGHSFDLDGCVVRLSDSRVYWNDPKNMPFVYEPGRYRTSDFIVRNFKAIRDLIIKRHLIDKHSTSETLAKLHEILAPSLNPLLSESLVSGSDNDSLESRSVKAKSFMYSVRSYFTNWHRIQREKHLFLNSDTYRNFHFRIKGAEFFNGSGEFEDYYFGVHSSGDFEYIDDEWLDAVVERVSAFVSHRIQLEKRLQFEWFLWALRCCKQHMAVLDTTDPYDHSQISRLRWYLEGFRRYI